MQHVPGITDNGIKQFLISLFWLFMLFVLVKVVSRQADSATLNTPVAV